jgi:glycosyltransferase involved in cell wall biosynthesis
MNLRILHVAPFFSPRMGGMPRGVHQLARHQILRGHSITILTSDFNFIRYPFPPSDYSVIALPTKWSQGGAYFSPGLIPWVKNHIGEFDAIHLHTVRTFQNIAVQNFALRRGIPYVITAHGTLPISSPRRVPKIIFDFLFGKSLRQSAKMWIAVSPLEVEQFRKFGIQDQKIRMVYNGMATDEFSNAPPRGSFRNKLGIANTPSKIILFFGRLHPLKNVGYLIEAFADLARKQTNLLLVIAGPDDGDLRRLQQIAEKEKIEAAVRIVGPLDGVDRQAALSDADVLVNPSASEIFGFSLFEALLCGTPVIAHEESGAGQMIAASGGGYLIPAGNKAAFSNVLLRALSDTAQSQETVAKGRFFIHQQLDWHRVSAQLEEIYLET